MKKGYAKCSMLMLIIIFIGHLFSCCENPGDGPTEAKRDIVEALFAELPSEERQKQYQELKGRISYQQKKLADDGSVEKARKYLLKALTDSVFPHWYETPWDFNGTTDVPGQGSIACGFFVSTTLKHAGLNIDRIKCGQQASSVFINALCKPGSVKWISRNDTAMLVNHLLAQRDGLYLIGLDYHTGFIQKDGSELWMIHAAYWPHHKVVKEKVQSCAHILESNVFVVGDLLGNDELIGKWMRREKIAIGE
jgi:hypothetical protein